jgi:hypothetical protein
LITRLRDVKKSRQRTRWSMQRRFRGFRDWCYVMLKLAGCNQLSPRRHSDLIIMYELLGVVDLPSDTPYPYGGGGGGGGDEVLTECGVETPPMLPNSSCTRLNRYKRILSKRDEIQCNPLLPHPFPPSFPPPFPSERFI